MDTSKSEEADLGVNGAQVIKRTDSTIFMRLPRGLWRSCGTCRCDTCKGREGYWDTLAIAALPRKANEPDTTWTVHMPEKRWP